MALHNPNLISFAAGLVDAPTLPVEQCAAITRCIERGVLYVPGDYCFHPDESGRVPQNCLRLCFGQVSHDQIDTGIQRLGKVVGELLETTPIVLGDSLGCCSLNPEPRTLSHE
jgi:alanine-alpha-ketoisovalerate/valine-pyruvate aminotransferase